MSENKSTICKMICKVFEQGEISRNQGITVQEDMSVIKNLQYGTDPQINLLDIYRKRDYAEKPLPVIVNVHGGGWVYGKKEGYQFYLTEFARQGYAVLSFDYHLAPQNHFPKPVEDTFEVFEWIHDHASEYDLDLQHIYAMGDSAGAHTLASYITAYYNRRYQHDLHLDDKNWSNNICPKAVILNCAIMSVTADILQKDEFVRILMQEYLEEESDLHIFNFVPYIEFFPAVYLMEANGDFVNSSHVKFIEKMTEKELPVEVCCYGDVNLELGHCFQLDIRNKEAEKCNRNEILFIEKERNS